MGNPTFPNTADMSGEVDRSHSSKTQHPSVPQDARSLPPEALDLAAKIFDLARMGNTQALQPYIEAGIPVNLTNSAGDTLIMLAAYHGHVETVRMLLGRGADVNVLNARGQSPLAGAVFKGHFEVVKALYEEGEAKISGETAGQPNAVDCARMFRRREILQLFGILD